MTERETGIVKWFNESRGHGHISRGAGKEVYVHYSAIEGEGFRTLRKGQRAESSVEQGPIGPRATHVRVLSSP